MKIELNNCNNIKSATIEIKEGVLNIKYGINGVGKTTLSKAILYKATEPEKLASLEPFDTKEKPNVNVTPELKSIKVFNESYVNTFVFQKGNLVKGNSFEIFVKPEDYDKSVKDLNDALTAVKISAQRQEQDLILGITDIKNYFNLTGTGELSGASKGLKACKDGNSLHKDVFPSDLTPFLDLLKDPVKNYKWLDWVTKGKEFDNKLLCQFCGQPLPKNFESIEKQLNSLFEKNNVKNRSEAKTAFGKILGYLSNDFVLVLKDVFEGKTFEDKTKENLTTLIVSIYKVKQLIDNVLLLDAQTIIENPRIIKEISSIKLGKEGLIRLFSNKEIIGKLEELNLELEKLEKLSDKFEEESKKANETLIKNAQDSKDQINEFLVNAGFDYYIEIESSNTRDAKISLYHISKIEVRESIEHLSFGERNAFAVVLFMFEALSENPQLIILDDPISSFDESKKYAIMHELFGGGIKNFSDKTVLMLTHDFNPIIDFLYAKKPSTNYVASYIKNEDSVVKEAEITRKDIKMVIEIAEQKFEEATNAITKLINLRRILELNGKKYSDEWCVISSLFKRQENPTFRDGVKEMPVDRKNKAINEIKKKYSSFDYGSILTIIKDKEKIKKYFETTSNYEKIQVYRILRDCHNITSNNKYLCKFIDETYHIENNLLFQLDPYAYDMVPSYITKACSRVVEGI